MLERIRQIPKRIVEMWKKLTKRQKIVTVSSIAAVIITLVVLIVLLNRVTYDDFATYENTETARSVMDVLSQNGIANRIKDDMVTVEVDITKKTDAGLAVAGSEALADVSLLTLQQLLDNDLSTTSSDKKLKANLYMQSNLIKGIKTMKGIDDAAVYYYPADTGNGILQKKNDTSCSVLLTVNDAFDYKKTPEAVATLVAYAIGNEDTNKVKVIDQYTNLLYGGEKTEAEKQDELRDKVLAYKQHVTEWYSEKMQELAIKNGFYDAEIVASLDIVCDQTSEIFTQYLPAEGQEQGLYSEYLKISSEGGGTTGDIPGTDSNDETDYYIQTGSTGSSSYDELRIKYIPSEKVTETVKDWGVINRDNSSLAVVLLRVSVMTEEELELLGLLEGTTFDEYVATHKDRTALEVPEEYFKLFSDASGIPIENISVLAYDQPNFIARTETESNISLFLEILLAALIIGLLIFVVFRAMKPEEIIETEPELSVERLLATTKENQSLEDIEFGEKSETRKVIEKYIDENPESAANLLRNWLNDDGWD
ncbi:MAG: hypothetical protein J5824_03130 [Lachnospiraceae bacterium]|nr:hypothetical protein [Lachnospiraceae bacterium]